MTLHDWLIASAKHIAKSGVSDTPRLVVELLLSHRLGKNRAYLVAFADTVLPDRYIAQLNQDIQALANGYPLAYLIGKKAFWDMELRVTEDTLIPRPDTEILVEVASQLFSHAAPIQIADLGTGSGAVAIALSRIFTRAKIVATDTSEAALNIARENAQQWQVAPITFTNTSWLNGFVKQSTHLIVSNPPYIAEGDLHLHQLRHEPISALTAPQKGLADIATIITQAKEILIPQGWLLLEHGYDQGKAVRALFAQCPHWQTITTHQDLGGNERVTVAQQCEH